MPFGGFVHPASVERGSSNLGAPGRQRGAGVTGNLFAAVVPETRTTAATADQRTPAGPARPQG